MKECKKKECYSCGKVFDCKEFEKLSEKIELYLKDFLTKIHLKFVFDQSKKFVKLDRKIFDENMNQFVEDCNGIFEYGINNAFAKFETMSKNAILVSLIELRKSFKDDKKKIKNIHKIKQLCDDVIYISEKLLEFLPKHK